MASDGSSMAESPAYRARQAMDGLRELREALGIIEAALVMALEGQKRATPNEVAERANKDFNASTTASIVGHILRQINIGIVVTHGKSRFVLEAGELKPFKDRLVKACNETAKELGVALAEFRDLSGSIKTLEEQWNQAVQLRTKERQLVRQIEEDRRVPSSLPALEHEAGRLRVQAEKTAALEKECSDLEQRIKAYASLEERQKSLRAEAAKYHAYERELAQQETMLGRALEDLKKRSAWVTYVDLDRNIQRQRAELAQITAQINERRSMLQKILGTNKVK